MAKALAFFPICRTIGNLTFYMMDGQNYVRKKSSLTAKRVKTGKQFARTRYYAGLLGQASQIGSNLFQALPPRWRQSWMYRTFTGEAMLLLKQGIPAEEAKKTLWTLYVAEIVKKAGNDLTAKPVTPRRPYTKRNTTYWTDKTERASKRKLCREQLRLHATLLAKASTLASKVYCSLPPNRELYRTMTGLAMVLLKEGLSEKEVRAELTNTISNKKPDPPKRLMKLLYQPIRPRRKRSYIWMKDPVVVQGIIRKRAFQVMPDIPDHRMGMQRV